MNEIIKSFKITFGIMLIIGTLGFGWEFFKHKQAESNCQEIKNLRNQLKKENIPTTMIEGNMALHNCY
jgi:uncharacterized alpha/beta hydrolase family protein